MSDNDQPSDEIEALRKALANQPDSIGEQPTVAPRPTVNTDQSNSGSDAEKQANAEAETGEIDHAAEPKTEGEHSQQEQSLSEMNDLSERYVIERTIGQGGYGEVFLATDSRLNRKVAIKRLRHEGSLSKQSVKRFVTEAQSVAALSHRNIIEIHDFGRDTQGPFLIMEYLASGSLLERCVGTPMKLEPAIDIVSQLCDGIRIAHQAGILHRDIKPSNILFSANQVPKLSDFGLAKTDSTYEGMTGQGVVLGTVDFMSPEQKTDSMLVDPRSDLWSLAATFYQMLTASSPKVIWLERVPKQLRKFFEKALQDNKDDRFQNADEFRDAVMREGLGSGKLALPKPSQKESRPELIQCLECKAGNHRERNFCVECGASMRLDCLNCKEDLRLWEKVCDHCGCVQEKLLQDKQRYIEQRKRDAEDRLESLEFADARSIVNELKEVNDPRVLDHLSWCEDFDDKIERCKSVAMKDAAASLDAALQFEERKDFSHAVDILKGIHQVLHQEMLPSHHETITDVIQRLTRQVERIDHLKLRIERRVENRQHSGLLAEIDNLLEISPDEPEILSLRDRFLPIERELAQQRRTLCRDAESLLRRGKPREALRTLEKIDSNELSEDQRDLKNRIIAIAMAEQRLNASLETAKSDGVIDFKEIEALLPYIQDFLDSVPHHKYYGPLFKKLKERRKRLLSRRKRYFDRASRYIKENRYQDCIECLEKIDPHLMDQDVDDLIEKAERSIERLNSLKIELDEAVGQRTDAEVLSLLEELLTLDPNDESYSNLRDEIGSRIAPVIVEQEQARSGGSLFDEYFFSCQFDLAADALESEAAPLGHDVQDRVIACREYAKLRREALAALDLALSAGQWEEGGESISAYQLFLAKNPSLTDDEFWLRHGVFQDRSNSGSTGAENERGRISHNESKWPGWIFFLGIFLCLDGCSVAIWTALSGGSFILKALYLTPPIGLGLLVAKRLLRQV